MTPPRPEVTNLPVIPVNVEITSNMRFDVTPLGDRIGSTVTGPAKTARRLRCHAPAAGTRSILRCRSGIFVALVGEAGMPEDRARSRNRFTEVPDRSRLLTGVRRNTRTWRRSVINVNGQAARDAPASRSG